MNAYWELVPGYQLDQSMLAVQSIIVRNIPPTQVVAGDSYLFLDTCQLTGALSTNHTTEHKHTAVEAWHFLEGGGTYTIANAHGKTIVIEVEAHDYIEIPAGFWHSFRSDKISKVVRFLKSHDSGICIFRTP